MDWPDYDEMLATDRERLKSQVHAVLEGLAPDDEDETINMPSGYCMNVHKNVNVHKDEGTWKVYFYSGPWKIGLLLGSGKTKAEAKLDAEKHLHEALTHL